MAKRRSLSDKQRNIGCLQDELLEEILCRLPNAKSAFRCKCVCKHWSDLISNPHFATRFVATKLESDSVQESFIWVAQYEQNTTSNGLLMMRLDDPISNTRDFYVSRLPYLPCHHENATAVGACNDLVLFRSDGDDRYDYYLYNVQTRQCLSLPAAPPFYHGEYSYTDGFICDPFYSCKGGKLSSIIRGYKIVVVEYMRNKAMTQLAAHMFSSDTYQWTDAVLSLPRACQVTGQWTTPFNFDGKIHYHCSEGMISFDPYGVANHPDNVIECHFVGWPANFSGINLCTGVRQGQMQVFDYDDKLEYLYVWVLIDYGGGEWSLLHKLKRRRLQDSSGFLLGQHPTKPDIVYLLNGNGLIGLCDISKRTLEVASRVSAKDMELLYPYYCLINFKLSLPIWPTSLPFTGRS